MRRNLDQADLAIVERLSRDARVSNREIAEQLGVTEGTVRARVKRMEEEKLIRITAVTNIDRFKDAALAYIWIEVERSGQTRQVAQQLAAIAELGFVGVMLGRCRYPGHHHGAQRRAPGGVCAPTHQCHRGRARHAEHPGCQFCQTRLPHGADRQLRKGRTDEQANDGGAGRGATARWHDHRYRRLGPAAQADGAGAGNPALRR